MRNVEDMENFTRQKVARARLAVDNAFRLVAQEALSATYWMNVRDAQRPGRSFGAAPTAAWQSLRAVIPWQSDSRPEVPAGELAYAFMVANPASTFMGGEQDPAVEVRAATRRARAHDQAPPRDPAQAGAHALSDDQPGGSGAIRGRRSGRP